jgi:20S proteasome alpha/beta subunit
MSSIGTGYDLDCTTYSPDGRIFQIEYAGKAVENSGMSIFGNAAVRCIVTFDAQVQFWAHAALTVL